MKRFLFVLMIVLYSQLVSSQGYKSLSDSLNTYFNETKEMTQKWKSLWNKDLYGPIIIVNPLTRVAYSNTPDTAGLLKKENSIYIGKLPLSVPVANASINWNGVAWAMILLPFIPKNDTDRLNLFTHELFHRSQSSLGFKLTDANNNHLNTKDGRIYLRLELEALIRALEEKNGKEQYKHVTNAMIFRNYRRSLFPGSDSTENILELNEGLAEYTGTFMSRNKMKEAAPFFIRKMKDFLTNATFVRTFPYRTIPVYGFFLKDKNKQWNLSITMQTNLTNYFILELGLKLPTELERVVKEIEPLYSYEAIVKEEIEREERTKKTIADYKLKFVENPYFDLIFENKKTSFDSRNLTPLEDKGTVYPTMTASDNWGVLTVDKVGALMSPNRDKVTITIPTKIENKTITGSGWTLLLNDGYKIQKDETTGNYKLLKTEK